MGHVECIGETINAYKILVGFCEHDNDPSCSINDV